MLLLQSSYSIFLQYREHPIVQIECSMLEWNRSKWIIASPAKIVWVSRRWERWKLSCGYIGGKSILQTANCVNNIPFNLPGLTVRNINLCKRYPVPSEGQEVPSHVLSVWILLTHVLLTMSWKVLVVKIRGFTDNVCRWVKVHKRKSDSVLGIIFKNQSTLDVGNLK